MTVTDRSHHDPDPVRFGLIGCGRIATSHLTAVAESPRAAIAGIAEIREEAGWAAAEHHRCRHFTDFSEPDFLDSIDAAIVSTPPSTHFSIASQLMERQIPTLIEKPLTVSVAEARELIRLSQEHSTLLMMASKFRYVPDIIEARSMLEAKMVGKIVLFENAFCTAVPMWDRWNSQPEVSGGGVLIDNGTHSVDIARYLLGPITSVQAQLLNTTAAFDVEDTARLQFRNLDGVLGLIDLSWTIDKESPIFVSIYGTEGTLQIGWSGSKLCLRGQKEWKHFGEGYDKKVAFAGQLSNFIAALHGEEDCLSSLQSAMASVEVVDSAYISGRNGNGWQTVESHE